MHRECEVEFDETVCLSVNCGDYNYTPTKIHITESKYGIVTVLEYSFLCVDIVQSNVVVISQNRPAITWPSITLEKVLENLLQYI